VTAAGGGSTPAGGDDAAAKVASTIGGVAAGNGKLEDGSVAPGAGATPPVLSPCALRDYPKPNPLMTPRLSHWF